MSTNHSAQRDTGPAGVAWVLRTMLALAVPSLAACNGPNSVEHATRGDAFVEQGKLPEASIEYRNALRIDPSLGAVRLKLGDVYLRTNEPAQALREYVRAADLMPDNLETQLSVGRLLFLAGQYTDAKTRATKAIEIDRNDPRGQILLGNTLLGLRDMDGAVAEYRQALVLNPSEEVAYRNIAVVQASAGQLSEAEATFRKAIEVAPKSIDARLAFSNFLWVTNRASEAEQLLKDTLALDRTNVRAAQALGTFYIGAKRVAEAEPYFKMIADAQKTPRASVDLADYYILAGRLDQARLLLQEATQDANAYAIATLRLAAIDVALGEQLQAQQKLRLLLERHPKDATARLFNARLLVADGKREEALAEVTNIVMNERQSPAAADAQFMAGTLQAALDRPEDATRSFEDVLRRRPNAVPAQLALARLRMARRDVAGAEKYVKDALATDASNPAARAELVRVLMASNRLTEARTRLASLRKEHPNAAAVLHLMAIQQMGDKQFDAARITYTRLLRSMPTDVDAMAGLVRLDLMTGRQQAAIDRVAAALKSSFPTAALGMLAAQVYNAVGDSTKAEEALRRAIELEPARLQAYGMLGTLYARQKRLREAADHFRQMTTKNPSSIAAGTMLGLILEARGETADAEKEYRRVLALDRDAPVAANNLAWMYISTGRNAGEALELAKSALRRLPDDPDVNDTLGWIYYKQGEFRNAIAHLEAAVSKAPNAAATHYHLGLAHMAYNEWERARDSFRRALSLNAEFDGMADARRRLTELGG